MDLNTTRQDVAPGAAELAAGMVGLEVAGVAVAAPAPAAAPAVEAVVRWLTEKKRQASYDLEFPLEVAGVEYHVITIRRMTGGEVAAMMEAMRAEPNKDHRWPMYFVGDAPLPDTVWDALDDDDRFALGEIATGFLPKRFRSPSPAATEPDAS